jgi:hypothetical protein
LPVARRKCKHDSRGRHVASALILVAAVTDQTKGSTMRTVIAIAIAAIALTAGAGAVGVAEAGATPCTYLCNQYVRPYYKPSTGTWVQGYWRNSPSDSYRATPYHWTAPASVDSGCSGGLLFFFFHLLVVDRRQVVERRVESDRVVEGLDVVEDGGSRFRAAA